MLETLWAYALLQSWGQYLTLAATVAYVLSIVILSLPVKITAKIPNLAMRILNFLAAKSRCAKIAKLSERTDHHGNPKS